LPVERKVNKKPEMGPVAKAIWKGGPYGYSNRKIKGAIQARGTERKNQGLVKDIRGQCKEIEFTKSLEKRGGGGRRRARAMCMISDPQPKSKKKTFTA